jgi:hypothetical protein
MCDVDVSLPTVAHALVPVSADRIRLFARLMERLADACAEPSATESAIDQARQMVVRQLQAWSQESDDACWAQVTVPPDAAAISRLVRGVLGYEERGAFRAVDLLDASDADWTIPILTDAARRLRPLPAENVLGARRSLRRWQKLVDLEAPAFTLASEMTILARQLAPKWQPSPLPSDFSCVTARQLRARFTSVLEHLPAEGHA